MNLKSKNGEVKMKINMKEQFELREIEEKINLQMISHIKLIIR